MLTYFWRFQTFYIYRYICIYELIFIKVDYAGSKGEEIIIKACKKSYMMLKVRDLGFFVILNRVCFCCYHSNYYSEYAQNRTCFVCQGPPRNSMNIYRKQRKQTDTYIKIILLKYYCSPSNEPLSFLCSITL